MNSPCIFKKIFFGTFLTAALISAAATAGTEAKNAVQLPAVEKNYDVKGIGKVNVAYTDAQSAPLSLEGLPWLKENKGAYIRIPARLTQAQTNRSIYQRLRHHTSGVALRFRSDSPVIMLRGELAYNSTMAHMTRVGSAGFDSYYRAASGNMEYQRSFLPAEAQKEFKIIMGYNPGKGMRDWQINFPLYGGVKRVELGVVEGSKLAQDQKTDPFLRLKHYAGRMRLPSGYDVFCAALPCAGCRTDQSGFFRQCQRGTGYGGSDRRT